MKRTICIVIGGLGQPGPETCSAIGNTVSITTLDVSSSGKMWATPWAGLVPGGICRIMMWNPNTCTWPVTEMASCAMIMAG